MVLLSVCLQIETQLSSRNGDKTLLPYLSTGNSNVNWKERVAPRKEAADEPPRLGVIIECSLINVWRVLGAKRVVEHAVTGPDYSQAPFAGQRTAEETEEALHWLSKLGASLYYYDLRVDIFYFGPILVFISFISIISAFAIIYTLPAYEGLLLVHTTCKATHQDGTLLNRKCFWNGNIGAHSFRRHVNVF